jgi:hypothetical protein
MASRNYDWKNKTKSFPYKSISDPKYIKDRNNLFKESGNGWWIFQGYSIRKYGKWRMGKKKRLEMKDIKEK